MNIKELQIGNWVTAHNRSQRIMCIDIRCDAVCFESDQTVFTDAPFVEPIKITPAILCHNGISIEERGEVLKHKSYPLEKWLIHTTFKDTWLWFNGYSQQWHLHDCNGQQIEYVHQLQNALQLCKIDKEIIL